MFSELHWKKIVHYEFNVAVYYLLYVLIQSFCSKNWSKLNPKTAKPGSNKIKIVDICLNA